MSSQPLSISVQGQFSAAHFYRNGEWSDEKNRAIFGLCFSDYGHGHDYQIELTVVSEKANWQAAHGKAKDVVRRLCQAWDHQHLNFKVPEFGPQGLIPTMENLATVLLKKIKTEAPDLNLIGVKLAERPDLWIELKVQDTQQPKHQNTP